MPRWIARTRANRLRPLLSLGVVLLAACAPTTPLPPPSGDQSPRVAQPPRVFRFDSRYENTSGISIFATNTASQRQTT